MNGQGNNGMNNNVPNNVPNNTPNNSNRVIRSKNINGGYESLDDNYTKEVMEENERRHSAMNYDLNKMNSELTVENNTEITPDDDFLSKAKKKGLELKNKGIEMFNKLRGDTHTNLSSSELRKMELQNKISNKQEVINQNNMNNMPPTSAPQKHNNAPQGNNGQQRPNVPQGNNGPQRPNNMPQMNNNGPQSGNQQMNNGVTPVMPIPGNIPPQQPQQGVMMGSNNNARMKKRVFDGLPAGNNNQKKGLFGNFFNKNKNVGPNGQNVEPWMLNQPLSAQSLGVSQNEVKKDVVVYDDSGKYFNASADVDRVSEDNSLHTENFAKPLFQKKVKPSKELERKKNGTLVRSYFGRNYDTVTMGVFSIAGLLFGGLRFITYKMFLLGLIVFGIQMYILCFIPWQTGIILYAVLGLILAFVGNPIIMGYARTKIQFYRMTHPKFVEEQLDMYVKSKSKTYGGLAFLIFVIAIGGTVYMYFAKDYQFKGMLGNGYGYIKKLVVNSVNSEPVSVKYDDSFDVSTDFTFTLPSEFVKSDNIYNYYISNDEYDHCSFSFRKVTNYNEANGLLQAVKKLNKASGKVETEQINDVLFATFNYTDNSGKNTYLSIKSGDNLYLIYYYSGAKTPQNVCDNYFIDIKNSIKKVEKVEENK